jgi:hypothetical protein
MHLGKLLARLYRFGHRAPEPVVDPVDFWGETFSQELPLKLDWARSVDVAAVAADADSSPDTVETLAGYPSLWLEFGNMIQNPERATLETVLALGKKIFDKVGKDAELWSWYQAYMRSPHGRGEVTPREYNFLSRNDLRFLDKVIDFRNYIGSRLKTYTTFREYYDAIKVLVEQNDGVMRDGLYEKEGPGYRAHDFDQRKSQLLDEAYASCKGFDGLVAFFHTIPRDSRSTPYWASAYDMLWKVACEISDTVGLQIKNAKTSADLELITIPSRIGIPDVDFTCRLERDLKERRTELLASEEEVRVRARLKAHA